MHRVTNFYFLFWDNSIYFQPTYYYYCCCLMVCLCVSFYIFMVGGLSLFKDQQQQQQQTPLSSFTPFHLFAYFHYRGFVYFFWKLIVIIMPYLKLDFLKKNSLCENSFPTAQSIHSSWLHFVCLKIDILLSLSFNCPLISWGVGNDNHYSGCNLLLTKERKKKTLQSLLVCMCNIGNYHHSRSFSWLVYHFIENQRVWFCLVIPMAVSGDLSSLIPRFNVGFFSNSFIIISLLLF